MKPNAEQEVKDRVAAVFDMRIIKEMSKRSGYPESTLAQWKRKPLTIKAVDLIRLEEITGERKQGET